MDTHTPTEDMVPEAVGPMCGLGVVSASIESAAQSSLKVTECQPVCAAASSERGGERVSAYHRPSRRSCLLHVVTVRVASARVAAGTAVPPGCPDTPVTCFFLLHTRRGWEARWRLSLSGFGSSDGAS